MRPDDTPVQRVSTKTCSRCGATKPLGEFFVYGKANPRPRPHCKRCHGRGRPPHRRTTRELVWMRLYRHGNKKLPTPSLMVLRAELGEPRTCHLCGEPLAWDTGTIDHPTPVARGGTNAPENLRWARRPCNDTKGTLTMDELAILVEKVASHLLGSR